VLGDLIQRGPTNKRWGSRSWQVAVFLSYASSAGHALIGRELYLCEPSRGLNEGNRLSEKHHCTPPRD
jgi:hypothetical protein